MTWAQMLQARRWAYSPIEAKDVEAKAVVGTVTRAAAGEAIVAITGGGRAGVVAALVARIALGVTVGKCRDQAGAQAVQRNLRNLVPV